ncbi:hypothetical protein ACFE04_004932 [Oxalis oulophora]
MKRKVSPFLLPSLIISTCFIFFFLSSPNPNFISNKLSSFTFFKDVENCDLSNGKWIPDLKGSQYTNSSCPTIPSSKNCFGQGRLDKDFLNWRWKPETCDLSRFDPKKFFQIVQNKKMAFIGDSVARNHMDSLLCLLSQEEAPTEVYKDSEDRNRIWYFPQNNFTLTKLWTKFFVEGKERIINNTESSTTDLYLDKIDTNWARELPSIDFAVMSAAHWFFRPLYLHEGNNITSCVYCDEPTITRVEVPLAMRKTLQIALNQIFRCKKCKNIITIVRTFSPSHFENGTWNTGGNCNRTGPFTENEIDMGGFEWEIRRAQVEEIERAKKKWERKGMRLRTLDVTRAMMMRPDGHPGPFWGNQWMKGYNDCVHWCLPGPVDAWNDFLLAFMRQEAG